MDNQQSNQQNSDVLSEEQSQYIRSCVAKAIVIGIINMICCVVTVFLALYARIWVYALYIAVPLAVVDIVLMVLIIRLVVVLRRYISNL